MLLALAAMAVLAALLAWQWRRERVMADCRDSGGDWHGPSSTCKLPDNRILIRPDLQRS